MARIVVSLQSELPSSAQDHLARVPEQAHDCILVTGDGVRLPASRFVLSLYSNFFLTLFGYGVCPASFKQEISTPSIFCLPSVSSQALQPILEFLETGSLAIDEATVLPFLETAEYLSLNCVSGACVDFMVQQLEEENVVGLLRYAKAHFLPRLESAAMSLILENFRTVKEKEEILSCPEDVLISILSSSKLQATEEEVWQLLLLWVEQNAQAASLALLRTVRFGRMNPQFFRRAVAFHPLLEGSPLPALVDSYLEQGSLPHCLAELTLPRHPTHVLFTFGGWSEGSAVPTVSIYNAAFDTWHEVAAEAGLPLSWAYMAAMYTEGQVYLVGGRAATDELRANRQLWRLDIASGTWHQLGIMEVNRNYVSAVLLDGSIYAIGGNSGHLRLNTVERYDIAGRQWYPAPSMRWMRSDAAAVVLNDTIYVLGGFDGFAPTTTVEQYTPGRKKWSMGPSMPEKISGLKAVAWRDRIFITGGWNGTRRLSTCYSHNPKRKGWERLADMKTPRSNHSMAVVGDRLVVAGGYDGSSTTALVEVYEPETNVWHEVSPLAARRSALSSCAVPLQVLPPQLSEELVSPDHWLAKQQQQLVKEQQQLAKQQKLLLPHPIDNQGEELEGLDTDAEFEMFEDSESEDMEVAVIDWEGHNISDESDHEWQ